jgi:hypothetical protein
MNAFSTSNTFFRIDYGNPSLLGGFCPGRGHRNGPDGTPSQAGFTPRAGFGFYAGGDIGMLTQLSFTAGTAHPKVLECASEPAQLVTREMGNADQNIGHGNGMGD